MKQRLLKLCSMILTLVMIFNMLPHHVLAETLSTEEMEIPSGGTTVESEKLNTSTLDVVEEITDKRTEFSKEFKMSNGLHMAAVYDSAVHYENDGEWEEINNTLIATVSGTDAVYTNTAGVWNISFPEQLSSANQITISKDGYTLRFGMAGQLTNNGAVVMNEGVATMSITDQISSGTLTVQEAQTSMAQVQQVDTATLRAEAEHPETIADKLNARLQYSNVYSNTNIVYDLQSNKLKESVIISRYDSNLRGYRYTLDVGTMVPVLNEDNSIWFYDSAQEKVVMVMPAPFMLDAENAYSGDVEVALHGSGSSYTLLYVLPQEWLSDADRVWPVVLDPVITADISVSNIRDVTVSEWVEVDYESPINSAGFGSAWGVQRFFIKYTEIPTLSSSDVIVHASMELYKPFNTSPADAVEVHKVYDTWESQNTTWSNMPDHDPTIEDFALVGSSGYYYWDVTDIVRDWYENENTGMLFKAPDAVEEARVSNYEEFYSSDYGLIYHPTLVVYFRNNNGLEGYWDYTSSSAGRAGTGYVNNYTGNLIWVHNDIGFGGNRMPVSISHVYNANDSQSNTFGMGYGWRTNFNQRVYQWSANSNYYVWEDSDGTDHYFYKESNGVYQDEDGLELTLTTTGSGTTKYCITDKNGNKSYFDTYGRLTKQQNNQATVSSINITYTTTSGYLISKITDGVGRIYNFTYSSGLLNQISYKGTGTEEISYVSFGYENSKLIRITDKDGKSATYDYRGYLLTSVTDVDGYKLEYAYTAPVNDWQPYRVRSVKETDDGVNGGEISIQYNHNQTTFTDHNGNKQIVQFNNWGNTIAIQDGEGRAQYAQYATDSNPNGEKGNQLSVASKLQNTVGNILSDNSFELGTKWTASGATVSNTSGTAYYGSKALKVATNAAGGAKTTFTAEPGKTYTFSAYVKTGNSAAYLTLGGDSSETLAANSGWTRLEVSYTNESSSTKSVTAQIMNAAAGTTFMDCVQLELAPTASRYNLIVNGDFRNDTGWSSSSGRTTGNAAAPQLSTNVYKLSGTYTSTNRISQTVNVSGSEGDTFVLAGWAKGNAAPLTQFAHNTYDSSDREFGIIAVFNYTDGTTSPILVSSDTENAETINAAKTDSFKLHFNPDVDNWQYAAVPIVAEKDYSSITVYLAYDYNVNEVFFDGIQLYKEQFGNSYTYDEKGNVLSVVDLQKQTTTYEYDTNNNLTEIIQDGQAKMTYTYDSYHNVKSATSAEGLKYTFTYDTYGNNTKVSITSGGVTMTSSATYADGNRLATTTDAAGKVTIYNYNVDTNVLEWVQYPNDTENARTEYGYDNMYRLASAAASTGTQTLTASYTYENDLLKSITTGSTTYSFGYGSFGLRSSIKVGTTTLASYTYTDRNNYLKKLAYGNGDSVEYTYDDLGRVTKERYEDGDTVTYTYDNDGALATVTDSATGRKTTYYYDFTDRLMKYVESGSGFSHSVGYSYDDLNNLTSLVETINGTAKTTTYTYDTDNRVTRVKQDANIWDYTYDAFGRQSSRILSRSGSTVLTESRTYLAPADGQTSGQVATVTSTTPSYSSAYTYTYDDNGNIKTVTSGSKTTTYTYDSANQLLREDNQAGGFTHVWTYDDAGNITSRKEYAYTTATNPGTALDTVSYTYGNADWGDLLTMYDGIRVYHDSIGNLTRYSTTTYTWEHGRELVSMGVAADLVILEQPEDFTGALGDRVSFSVSARGNSLTYQWQLSNNNGQSWGNSSAGGYNTPTIYGFSLSEAMDGRLYRCKITDADGNVFYSRWARLVLVPIAIQTQPADFYGDLGDTADFSVTASGAGLTYRWQFSNNGGSTWTDSSQTGYNTDTIRISVTEPRVGYLYRCKLTDADGNTIYTEPGQIRTDPLAILHQPEDFVGVVGDTVRFTVEARGEGLTYQWQSSVNGGKTWSYSAAGGYNTPSMTVMLQAHNPGYQYRCKITDANGSVIYSEPAEIKAGQVNWDFTYDANGMRTQRTNGTTTYGYVYNGGQLSQMTVGGQTLRFTYGTDGAPTSVTYGTNRYFYVKNLQGDVMALVDTTGKVVVEYTYDAWGNILSISGEKADTLGKHNPLRYRGYVYDQETNLYYLQSRYYDPQVGRFLNADALVSTGQGLLGHNMYAYCGNNPITRSDPTGYVYDPAVIRNHFFYSEISHTYGGHLRVNPTDYQNYQGPRGTIVVGYTLSASGGAGGSISGGITADRDGNIGVIGTLGAYATSNVTPSWGHGLFVTITDADDIFKQREASIQGGFSVNLWGSGITFEQSTFRNSDTGEMYNGYSIMIGPSINAPVEVHGGATYSWVEGFNFFDCVLDLFHSFA